MTIGEKIQSARKQAGLTQIQLGKKLGVSGSMIGQWENDLRKPKSETLERIANALGVYALTLVPDSEFERISPDRVIAEMIDFYNAKTDPQKLEIDAELEQYLKDLGLRIEVGFDESTGKKAYSVYALSKDQLLMNAYEKLNDEGKNKVIEYAEDLVRTSKYKHTEPLLSNPDKDTSEKEKPPEGEIKPTDGTEE